MALGGSNISWAEAVPAGSESVALGDDRIRSFKTDVRNGLDSEHVWPSSGGTAGQHRAGSARAFWGTQSQVSSTDTDGRLMVTSDKSRLMSVTSHSNASAFMLGAGPLTPSFASYVAISLAGAPQTKGIIMQQGIEVPDADQRVVVVFPTAYDITPLMFLQSGASNFPAARYNASLNSAYASGFSARIIDGAGIARSDVSLHWLAIGHRNL